jgi:uncharacterized protein YdhG (YjbR/CyaY superfamily)
MHAVAKDIGEYIELQPEEVRATLTRIRNSIKKAVPEAEELISYQMPAFRLNGMLVWFAAFKKHYTIFFPGKVLQEFKDELKTYELIKSGAGIKIPLGQSIPYELISRIVKARKSEIYSRKPVRQAGREAK